MKLSKMSIRKQITTLFALAVLILPLNSKKENGTIYIILWTMFTDQHWNYRDLDREEGYAAFTKRGCAFQNCYLTTNQTYFESVLDFDVLLFNTVQLSQAYKIDDLPTQRSPSQLYVLFSVEPAAYTSIPDFVDDIFNLTWTYLLKSDIVHPYFFIKNQLGEIIAPKVDVHWKDINTMQSPHPAILQKIKNKSIAALWVASNCQPKIRADFARKLNRELSKYGHHINFYGRCGNKNHCQKNPEERDGVLTNCHTEIESAYYFYLAFENSFTEDYVSAKVLHGLLHFSVPIVYGGANYTRFLPDGTYLNAMELGEERLAREMNNIMNNSQNYYNFFKWHNYYSIHDAGADGYRESVCAFCAYLNDKANINKTHVYQNMTGWYNAPFPELYPNIPYSDFGIEENKTSNIEEVAENSVETTTSTILSKIFDFFFDVD